VMSLRMSHSKEEVSKTLNTKKKIKKNRQKTCIFCEDNAKKLDYKDVNRLRKFITERSKILPRRLSGNCAKHQRQVTRAIKRARILALLPFTVE